MKYTLEFKLECIKKHKNSLQVNCPDGVNKTSFMNHVLSWEKAYDDLGVEGLIHKTSNKQWTPEERFELVAKVLAGNSIKSVARNAHINDGQLYQWVRKYSENGMDGLQCRKGWKPNKIAMEKKKKEKLTVSEKEELKLLREKVLFLEMENEYLKKLDTLVSKREAAEAKVKKQK